MSGLAAKGGLWDQMRLRPDIFFYPGANGLDFSGEIDSNTVLLAGNRHLLIDPGVIRRWDGLTASIEADGLDPADIGLVLLTHGHPDHAEAVLKCRQDLGCQVVMGHHELDFLAVTGRIFYRKDFYQKHPSGARYRITDYVLPDRSMMDPVFPGPLRFLDREFRLHETAGHSPGGLCLHWPEAGLLVVGDNYFPGTIGAYDLPGGSFAQMERSLKILRGLGDVDLVVCGHGEPIDGRGQVLANYGVLFAEVEDKKARRASEAGTPGGRETGPSGRARPAGNAS